MGNIIDFNKFRAKKLLEKDLARNGRTPLMISHKDGKIGGEQPNPIEQMAILQNELVRIALLVKLAKTIQTMKEQQEERKD